MGTESGRSARIVTCAVAAVFGLAAGVLIGLAIGGVKSESRQSIDAERDRLAQEAGSLAGERSAELTAIAMALGSTRTLLDLFNTSRELSESGHNSFDQLHLLLQDLASKLARDAKVLRKYKVASKPLVDHWIAAVEKLSREGKLDGDVFVRCRNHFDLDVFGTSGFLREKKGHADLPPPLP